MGFGFLLIFRFVASARWRVCGQGAVLSLAYGSSLVRSVWGGFWVGFWVGLRARDFPTERVSPGPP